MKGDGWYKGPDGYVYETPAPAPVAVKAAEPEPIEEAVVEDIEPLVAEVEVPAPENDYLPPNEYLPPVTETSNEAAKRKLRKLRFRRRH